eukprot:gene8937-6269_t
MVGKTYLRYVVGPQGGTVVSNEALGVSGALGRPQYVNPQLHAVGGGFRGGAGRGRGGGRGGRGMPQRLHAPSLSSLLFLPSLEAVRVYSVKSGAVLHTLIPAELKMPVEVSALQVIPLQHVHSQQQQQDAMGTVPVLQNGWMLLVGYNNGYVAVFSCTATNNYGKPVCLFYALGHKIDTKVLALAADANPETKTLLCSAGQDTDVTVWDLIGMEPAFRLRGHRGGVTGMAFVPPKHGGRALTQIDRPAAQQQSGGALPSVAGSAASTQWHSGVGVQVLVTAGADGWIKVWDLHLRQCLQTLVACDTQVTALYMDPVGARLYCGLRENVIKVYNMEALSAVVGNGAATMAATGGAPPSLSATSGENSALLETLEHGIVPHGDVARRHHKPITFMSATANGLYLLACTSNTVEVFRMNTVEEVRKKIQRKKKRKQHGKKNQVDEEEEEHNDEDQQSTKKKQRRTEDGSTQEGAGAEDAHQGRPANAQGGAAAAVERTASEEVTLLRTFFLAEKVRSACFLPGAGAGAAAALEDMSEEELHIAITFRNNDVRTYTSAVTTSTLEGALNYRLTDLKPKFSLTAQGHQNDVRGLRFVDTDTGLISMSKEKLMLWTVSIRHDRLTEDWRGSVGAAEASHDFYDEKEANLMRVEEQGTLVPVGQVAVEEATAMDALHSALCCVGQADGALLLVDVAAALVLFTEPNAHMGGVKHVTRTPDRAGFISVGDDRRMLSWTIGVAAAPPTEATERAEDDDEEEVSPPKTTAPKQEQPTLLLAHEVELTELPLFVECSDDQRYLGVGLQNNTIQLFFADSLKPYLSLFGHKLPPTAMSFSTDGTLVASVGMDKSLRFWGTDFGDCHRAIHAHDEYVTDVAFLQDTHYVFTVSMDGSVKQWDGDRFTMIQLFRQHQRGLWSVAATVNGTCVVAAGADKCLRAFLRTDGIVFPDEEEERLAHEAMEEEAAKQAARARLDGSGDAEVGVAGHATATTAEAAERLMSALDLVSVEQQRQQNPDDLSPRHPLLANKTEWEYLWSVIQSIRPSDLRHALNGLTSLHVDALLNALLKMTECGVVLNYEIAARILLGLVMPAPGMSSTGTGAFRFIAIAGDAAGPAATSSSTNGKTARSGEEKGEDEGTPRGLQRLEILRRRISTGLDQAVSRLDYSTAGLQAVRHALEEKEKIRFFDLSKIQGHKKKYHSQAFNTSLEIKSLGPKERRKVQKGLRERSSSAPRRLVDSQLPAPLTSRGSGGLFYPVVAVVCIKAPHTPLRMASFFPLGELAGEAPLFPTDSSSPPSSGSSTSSSGRSSSFFEHFFREEPQREGVRPSEGVEVSPPTTYHSETGVPQGRRSSSRSGKHKRRRWSRSPVAPKGGDPPEEGREGERGEQPAPPSGQEVVQPCTKRRRVDDAADVSVPMPTTPTKMFCYSRAFTQEHLVPQEEEGEEQLEGGRAPGPSLLGLAGAARDEEGILLTPPPEVVPGTFAFSQYRDQQYRSQQKLRHRSPGRRAAHQKSGDGPPAPPSPSVSHALSGAEEDEEKIEAIVKEALETREKEKVHPSPPPPQADAGGWPSPSVAGSPIPPSSIPSVGDPSPLAHAALQLRHTALAWCPWPSFTDAPTTLSGWGLPPQVVQQWATSGLHRLHPWQRACLFEFCEHVAKGLRRCAATLEKAHTSGTPDPVRHPPAGRVAGPPPPSADSAASSTTSVRLSYPSRNLVYAAPTSGGKALVSDVLVLRTLLGAVHHMDSTPQVDPSRGPSSPSGPTPAGGSGGGGFIPFLGSAFLCGAATGGPSMVGGGHATQAAVGGGAYASRTIAIYALPFVALAEERARQLEHLCAGLPQVNVVCLAGGAPLLLLEDRLSHHRHLVYVCTNEKAHALWRELECRQRLAEVVVVVVDEVHYLCDKSRGYVLELFLTGVLRYASASGSCLSTLSLGSGGGGSTGSGSGQTSAAADRLLAVHHEQCGRLQLLVTSATIANPQTLAKWCGNAFLFLTDHRPVPLQCYAVVQRQVYDAQQRVVRDLSETLQTEIDQQQREKGAVPSRCATTLQPGNASGDVQLDPLALNPRGEEEHVALLLATEGLSQGFQVLLFTPTRREAELTARRLATAVARHRYALRACGGAKEGGEAVPTVTGPPGVSQADAGQLLEFRDSPPAVKDTLGFTCRHGRVGFHHAGLGGKDRGQLEHAYRQGTLWALCCTTTLSTGMNLPCRRVIFTAPRIGVAPLDTLTFLQAAGRAGRVGLDPYGEGFVLGKPNERSLLRQLAASQLPPMESRFAPGQRGVARVLLDGMASYAAAAADPSYASRGRLLSGHGEGGAARMGGPSSCCGLGPREVHRVLLGTLYAVVEQEKALPDSEYAYYYQTCQGVAPPPSPPSTAASSTLAPGSFAFSPALFEATKAALILLESNRFISFHSPSSSFSLTPLGLATAASLFSPEDALLVLQDLQRSTRQFCLADDLHLLYHCTPLQHDLEPDWHSFYHCWGPQIFQGPTAPLIAQVVEVEERTLAGFAMAPPSRNSKHPVVMRCRRLFGALVLSGAVREQAPGDVALRFGIYGGAVEVQRLMEAAALFAGSLARFAYTLNWWYLPPLFNIMAVRLRRGVASDLLPLMDIEGLSPWRARILFDKGYRTVRSIVGATPAELEAVFSKHSLQGFELAVHEREAGGNGMQDMPEDLLGEPGEGGGEQGNWCQGGNYKEIVRQLQHRAKLVLWREAKDLEALLAAPALASAPAPAEVVARTDDLPCPPLEASSVAPLPDGPRERENSGKDQERGPKRQREEGGRAPVSSTGLPSSTLDNPTSSEPKRCGTYLSLPALLLLPRSRRVEAEGVGAEGGDTRPPHHAADRVVVCLVEADDPKQVAGFESCFNDLVLSVTAAAGATGGQRRRRELFVSIRAVPDEDVAATPSKAGAAPRSFTLLIGCYACNGHSGSLAEGKPPCLSLANEEQQVVRDGDPAPTGLPTAATFASAETGGVVFALHHCPCNVQDGPGTQGGSPIYRWWQEWLRVPVESLGYQRVWLGLQQQARFLVSVGWLHKDAVLVPFYPIAESRGSSPAQKGDQGRHPLKALHDPLIAFWMLHPDVDTSGVANARYSSQMLPPLLRASPAPAAQQFLRFGAVPPPSPTSPAVATAAVLSAPSSAGLSVPGSGWARRHRSSSSHASTSLSSARVLVVTMWQLHPWREGNAADQARGEGDGAGEGRGQEPISARRSRRAYGGPYTGRGHQESMGCLAAAALAAPLLHLMEGEGLMDSYTEREMWVPLLAAQMEMAGVGFDLRVYPPLLQAMQAKVHEITAYAYELVGRSNWSLSSPKDCAAALYDDLRLPCLHYLGSLDQQHGAPLPHRGRLLRENRSTKAAVLVHLARLYPDNPLPSLLMEFRRLDGWGEKYMEPLQRAALQTVRYYSSMRADTQQGQRPSLLFGRVHGHIFTTATGTGRLAMSEPSLQTIPHPVVFALHGRTVEVNLRRALVPLPLPASAGAHQEKGFRHGPPSSPVQRQDGALAAANEDDEAGGAHLEGEARQEQLGFLSADYSHIEARLLAHFTQDVCLLSAFPLPTPLAFLSSPTSEMDAGVGDTATHPPSPPRDIFRSLAAEMYSKASPVDVTPEERRIAKSIWYGMMYGRGKNSIANELALTTEAAESFLARLREKYATTIRCMAGMADEAARRGFVRTLLGRKRWLPSAAAAASPRSRPQQQQGWNAFQRVAINTLCQASAADVMKEAMVRIALDPLFQAGAPSSPHGRPSTPVARLVLQVHDELLFEVKYKDRRRVAAALLRHMDLAADLHLRVPLVINFQWGTSWGDMVPLSFIITIIICLFVFAFLFLLVSRGKKKKKIRTTIEIDIVPLPFVQGEDRMYFAFGIYYYYHYFFSVCNMQASFRPAETAVNGSSSAQPSSPGAASSPTVYLADPERTMPRSTTRCSCSTGFHALLLGWCQRVLCDQLSLGFRWATRPGGRAACCCCCVSGSFMASEPDNVPMAWDEVVLDMGLTNSRSVPVASRASSPHPVAPCTLDSGAQKAYATWVRRHALSQYYGWARGVVAYCAVIVYLLGFIPIAEASQPLSLLHRGVVLLFSEVACVFVCVAYDVRLQLDTLTDPVLFDGVHLLTSPLLLPMLLEIGLWNILTPPVPLPPSSSSALGEAPRGMDLLYFLNDLLFLRLYAVVFYYSWMAYSYRPISRVLSLLRPTESGVSTGFFLQTTLHYRWRLVCPMMVLLWWLTMGLLFHKVDPFTRSFADGVWLSFQTFSTLGYGDHPPSCRRAKWLMYVAWMGNVLLWGYAVVIVLSLTFSANASNRGGGRQRSVISQSLAVGSRQHVERLAECRRLAQLVREHSARVIQATWRHHVAVARRSRSGRRTHSGRGGEPGSSSAPGVSAGGNVWRRAFALGVQVRRLLRDRWLTWKLVRSLGLLQHCRRTLYQVTESLVEEVGESRQTTRGVRRRPLFSRRDGGEYLSRFAAHRRGGPSQGPLPSSPRGRQTLPGSTRRGRKTPPPQNPIRSELKKKRAVPSMGTSSSPPSLAIPIQETPCEEVQAPTLSLDVALRCVQEAVGSSYPSRHPLRLAFDKLAVDLREKETVGAAAPVPSAADGSVGGEVAPTAAVDTAILPTISSPSTTVTHSPALSAVSGTMPLRTQEDEDASSSSVLRVQRTLSRLSPLQERPSNQRLIHSLQERMTQLENKSAHLASLLEGVLFPGEEAKDKQKIIRPAEGAFGILLVLVISFRFSLLLVLINLSRALFLTLLFQYGMYEPTTEIRRRLTCGLQITVDPLSRVRNKEGKMLRQHVLQRMMFPDPVPIPEASPSTARLAILEKSIALHRFLRGVMCFLGLFSITLTNFEFEASVSNIVVHVFLSCFSLAGVVCVYFVYRCEALFLGMTRSFRPTAAAEGRGSVLYAPGVFWMVLEMLVWLLHPPPGIPPASRGEDWLSAAVVLRVYVLLLYPSERWSLSLFPRAVNAIIGSPPGFRTHFGRSLRRERWLWLLLVGLILFALAALYRMAEDTTILDAFYFCASTAALVGFGDVTPKSVLGRVVAVAVWGLGVLIVIWVVHLWIDILTLSAPTRNLYDFLELHRLSLTLPVKAAITIQRSWRLCLLKQRGGSRLSRETAALLLTRHCLAFRQLRREVEETQQRFRQALQEHSTEKDADHAPKENEVISLASAGTPSIGATDSGRSGPWCSRGRELLVFSDEMGDLVQRMSSVEGTLDRLIHKLESAKATEGSTFQVSRLGSWHCNELLTIGVKCDLLPYCLFCFSLFLILAN